VSREAGPPVDDWLGQELNERYRLDAELGRGGMSTVYRAHDMLLDRDVAVKVLSGAAMSGERRARLLVEAKAAARLNHANIVAVYDAGEAGGSPFIVMEWVSGQSLHEHRPKDLAEILSIAQQVCAALDHAHSHGIVHRDLKPENILIAADGTAKLADFGLAHTVASRLTVEGTIVGTVFYLAPEQVLGGEIDGRTDLYALGVLLYELVAGRLPFVDDDPLAVISQHLYAPPVPPRTFSPDLPVALEAAILKLLAKAQDMRYASAGEVASVLREIGAPPVAPAPEADRGAASLLQQLGSGRLIGRQAELAHLRALWSQAQQGSAQLALISGEPGVGKTRLADELMVYTGLSGAAVLEGGCSETMMGLPYLPFVEALRAWVHGQSDESLRANLASTASELARLAPEIGDRLSRLPANPPLSPQEERLRLFDHVARFFQSLASGHGLLLFVDDLHWADQGTLVLLRYLLRALRDDRLLLLATYRDTELDRAHPLAAALVEWTREQAVSRLSLSRLTAADTADLLATLFGAEQVTDEFATAIYGETEGNPYFVEEVVKALVEQGQIYRKDGEWQRLEMAELTIPQSVVEAIGRRLSRLGQGSVDILHTASALGRSFAFQELAAATSLDEDALLDALDEALDAQLVRAGEGQRFVFTHDKIREVLYRELNPVRRQRLHQHIGEALEQVYAGNVGPHVQALATHFVQGGDGVRGLQYLRQAGDLAVQVYAYDEALAEYEQAVELAEALGRTAEAATIHEEMARVYSLHGPVDQAVAHYEQALALTPPESGRLKADIGLVYAGVGDGRGPEVLQAALDELDTGTQPNDVARALAGLGRYHHYRGQHHLAIDFLERARRIAEPEDDPATLTEIYGYLAGAYQHLRQMEDSMAWARRSIDMGKQKNYPRAINIGYEFFAEDLFATGYWRDALRYSDLSREMGEQTGAQARVAWAGLSRAVCLYGLGDLVSAADAAQESLAKAEWIGDLRLAILVGSHLAVCQADLGEDDAAQAAIDLALEQSEELDQVFMRCASLNALGYFHYQRREWARAADPYDECYRLVAPTDTQLPLPYLGPVHALACIELGRLDDAAASLERFLSAARAVDSVHYVAVARGAEGQRMLARGDGSGAIQALDEAVVTLRDIGSRLELGRALVRRSLVHGEIGHSSEARRDREEARAVLGQCGAVRDLEWVS
jgi:tetratricopeptide (TPR) repeat protein/predicted Ser/Thr protein kinase